jgi:hypothetical protein
MIDIALNFKTYHLKHNGKNSIVFVPDKKGKYGLFNQDKTGKFNIDITDKYFPVIKNIKENRQMGKFEELYENTVKKLSDLSPEDIEKIESFFDIIQRNKNKIKMMNGVTRRDKKNRDMHDEIIKNRDNDVQLTAVEVEE